MANQTFNLQKEFKQTNKYYFTVEAETEEEAKLKLEEFLKKNDQSCPFQFKVENGIMCYDREVDV